MFLTGLLGRLLERIAVFSSRHPFKVLITLFIVTLGAGFYAWGITIDPSIGSLLPKNRPLIQEYNDTEADLMPTEFMIQVIEIPEKLPLIRYRKFIRAYKEGLRKIPELDVKRLDINRKLAREVKAYLFQHGLLLMREDTLSEFNNLLDPQHLQANLTGSDPYRPYLHTKIFDPLNVVSFVRGLIPMANRATLDLSEDFFITQDPKVLFFMMGSDWPWAWDRTQKIVNQAKEIQKETWEKVAPEVKRTHFVKTMPYPKITWLGKAMDVLRMTHSIWETFLACMISSPFLIGIVFLLFFRNVRSLFLAYVPVLIGIVWSFAFARLTVGKLNMLSVICGAMLLGLGIDFPSYLLNQYYRRRLKGASLEEAIASTWRETGRPVCFGAFTTIAAFSALLGSRLPAFRDIGFISGGGLFLTLAAVLVLLPAMLKIFDSRIPARPMRDYPESLIRMPLKKPGLTLLVCLLFFGGLTSFISRFHFQSAFKEAYYMIRQPAEVSSETDRRFSSLMESSLTPFQLIVEGSSLQDALEKNDSLAALLRQYKKKGQIAFFDSLAYWLPGQSREARLQQVLPEMENLDSEIFVKRYEPFKSEIQKKTDVSRRVKSSYNIYGKELAKFLKGRTPTDVATMKKEEMKPILDHYLVDKKGRLFLTTYVYLPQGDYPALRKSLMEKLDQEEMFKRGEVRYHSVEGVIQEIRNILDRDLLWLGSIVLLMSFLIFLIAFRSVKITLISLFPMILGGFAAVGAYTLFRGAFSVFNILWVPIYIGMATDDALHIGAILKNEKESLADALRHAGSIIVLTSLTTMSAFGTVIFSPIEMLKRISIWIIIAMGCELIASLFLLPALLKMTKIKNQ